MPASVTLRAIAAKAGLSAAAVSHALRNSPEVSAATRDRVREIALRMGWRPNPTVAAWMAHRRSGKGASAGECIAYLNCFPDLQAWSRLLSGTRFVEGAKSRARELGFRIEEFWFYDPAISAKRMESILKARGIRSILIGSAATAHAHVTLDWTSFSAVAQGFSVARPQVSRAANDYTHSVSLAIRELRRLGYRRIGLHLWPQVDARCQRQFSGAFLAYQGLLEAKDRVPIFTSPARHTAKVRRWLEATRPEAILSHQIEMKAAVQSMGRQVPAEIGFAMLDLHPKPHHADPPQDGCAGVDMLVETAGAAAVDLLAAQMLANETGLPAHPRIILTRGRWVPGSSVRKIGPVAGLPGLPKLTSLIETG